MPNPASNMIPPDAAAKAEEKAKTVDYYADLTDEERAQEGLPAREPAKAEPAPGEKPAPAEEPEEEEEEEEEQSIEEEDAAIEKLFHEIANLREDIDTKLGKAEPAKTEKEVDARLKAALESDDESTRYLAEQLQAANDRIERVEADARQERVGRQLAKDDADFDALRQNYSVGGKPLGDAHVDAIEDFILKNPEVGSRLSIEQIARVVFPDAVKVGPKSSPARGPDDSSNGKGSQVATIVDEGSPGGAPAGPWKPRPNESVESAVQEAGKRFGWIR